MTGVGLIVFGVILLPLSFWVWRRRTRPETRRNMRAGAASSGLSWSDGPVSSRQAAVIPVVAGCAAVLCIVYGIATL